MKLDGRGGKVLISGRTYQKSNAVGACIPSRYSGFDTHQDREMRLIQAAQKATRPHECCGFSDPFVEGQNPDGVYATNI